MPTSFFTLSVQNTELSFSHVRLDFQDDVTTNVFSFKNNKTLAETLASPKYRKLKGDIEDVYVANLSQQLGEFLYDLKKAKSPLYLKFLNQHGDKVYCRFGINAPEYKASKGLYAYLVDGQIKYIGRCLDNFGKRINQGYGHIHPKNCYLDGQSTNCHLNSLVTPVRDRVTLCVCKLDNNDQIKMLEAALIKQLKPEWNIALKGNKK